jgi:hypothetical protein
MVVSSFHAVGKGISGIWVAIMTGTREILRRPVTYDRIRARQHHIGRFRRRTRQFAQRFEQFAPWAE